MELSSNNIFLFFNIGLSKLGVFLAYFLTLCKIIKNKKILEYKNVSDTKEIYTNSFNLQREKTLCKITILIIFTMLLILLIMFEIPEFIYSFLIGDYYNSYVRITIFCVIFDMFWCIPNTICNFVTYAFLLPKYYNKNMPYKHIFKVVYRIAFSFFVPNIIFYYLSIEIIENYEKNFVIPLTIFTILYFLVTNQISSFMQANQPHVQISSLSISLQEKFVEISKNEKIDLKNLLITQNTEAVIPELKSNYISAFYIKKIILSEEIILHLSEDEVISILYHELGHIRNSDTTKNNLQGILTHIVVILMFQSFIYSSFSNNELTIYVKWFYFRAYTLVLMLIKDAIFCFIARRNEKHADKFSVHKTNSLEIKSALKKIYAFNLIDIYTSDLEIFLFNHYESYNDRINLVKNFYEKCNKTHK